MKVTFLLILLSSCFFNKPIYKRGDCFIKEEIIIKKPTEYWHKPYLKGKVEYLVLKVGKKNYQVVNSKKEIIDFPYSQQSNTIKSHCNMIYKKSTK